jgi:hypothetical protein
LLAECVTTVKDNGLSHDLIIAFITYRTLEEKVALGRHHWIMPLFAFLLKDHRLRFDELRAFYYMHSKLDFMFDSSETSLRPEFINFIVEFLQEFLQFLLSGGFDYDHKLIMMVYNLTVLDVLWDSLDVNSDRFLRAQDSLIW